MYFFIYLSNNYIQAEFNIAFIRCKMLNKLK